MSFSVASTCSFNSTNNCCNSLTELQGLLSPSNVPSMITGSVSTSDNFISHPTSRAYLQTKTYNSIKLVITKGYEMRATTWNLSFEEEMRRRSRPEVKFSLANLVPMGKVAETSSSFCRRRKSVRFAVLAKT